MTTKPLVAATDGSEESLRAVEWAAQEAILRGAALRIVAAEEMPSRVYGPPGAAGLVTLADALRENRDRALQLAVKRAVAVAPQLVTDADPLTGPIAQSVTASGTGAQLLVVGSRGNGAFAAMLLGSVSRYVATHASCPVAVIRDAPPVAHRRIGVGIRDVDHCQDALAFAFAEAVGRHAALVAVHAWHGPADHGVPEEAATRYLTELLASWADKYPGVPISQEVVHGHPGRALAGLSARCDLTVLGRHAPHGSGLRGPGTVTHAVLSHAHGPVITVPSPAAD